MKTQIKSSRVTLDNKRSSRRQTANTNIKREVRAAVFPSDVRMNYCSG